MTTRRLSQIVVLSLSTMGPPGCSSYNYAPVAPMVTPTEIQVYTAWLLDYQKEHPAQKLKVLSVTSPILPNTMARTKDYDPAEEDRKALRRDGVKTAGFDELVSLGGAFYPITAGFDPKLATFVSPCFVGGTCPEAEAEDPNIEVVTFDFSRVVFTRDGKMAFLEATFSIERGDSHYGGQQFYLMATRSGNTWQFKQVGPLGIS